MCWWEVVSSTLVGVYGCDGNGGGRFRIGGESCCKAVCKAVSLRLLKWENVFLAAF